jgi:hypothetical protein
LHALVMAAANGNAQATPALKAAYQRLTIAPGAQVADAAPPPTSSSSSSSSSVPPVPALRSTKSFALRVLDVAAPPPPGAASRLWPPSSPPQDREVVVPFQLDGSATLSDLAAAAVAEARAALGDADAHVALRGLPASDPGLTLNELKIKAPHALTAVHVRGGGGGGNNGGGHGAPPPPRQQQPMMSPRSLVASSGASALSLRELDEPAVAWSDSEGIEARIRVRVASYGGYVQLARPDPNKRVLVLDIDFTILDTDLYNCAAAALSPSRWCRPGLHAFLGAVSAHYNIVLWSATGLGHILRKLRQARVLPPGWGSGGDNDGDGGGGSGGGGSDAIAAPNDAVNAPVLRQQQRQEQRAALQYNLWCVAARRWQSQRAHTWSLRRSRCHLQSLTPPPRPPSYSPYRAPAGCWWTLAPCCGSKWSPAAARGATSTPSRCRFWRVCSRGSSASATRSSWTTTAAASCWTPTAASTSRPSTPPTRHWRRTASLPTWRRTCS